MIRYFKNRRKSLPYRVLSAFVAFTFSFSYIVPPSSLYAQGLPATVMNLPVPGTPVPLTPGFTPARIIGMTIHADNPLMFDFMVDPGDIKLNDRQMQDESLKLVKYFLASLTVPADKLWVNLSPYEKDKIVPEEFGQTEMGAELLAQDYMLKQLTASLMNPEDELGKKFWDRVYEKAQKLFGTTEIPLNTFNKVWIVPEKAVVYAKGLNVFVLESRFRVMMEEDYLALRHHSAESPDAKSDVISGVSSSVIKEVLLPEIEKEVNEGKTFANLRQIHNSLILAAWYKQNLKESLLGQIYADKGKTGGLTVEDKETSQKIYEQYVAAFQKGVHNFIKEDYDPATKQIIPRKYFSGGVNEATLEIEGRTSPAPEVLKAFADTADDASVITAGLEGPGQEVSFKMPFLETTPSVKSASPVSREEVLRNVKSVLAQYSPFVPLPQEIQETTTLADLHIVADVGLGERLAGRFMSPGDYGPADKYFAPEELKRMITVKDVFDIVMEKKNAASSPLNANRKSMFAEYSKKIGELHLTSELKRKMTDLAMIRQISEFSVSDSVFEGVLDQLFVIGKDMEYRASSRSEASFDLISLFPLILKKASGQSLQIIQELVSLHKVVVSPGIGQPFDINKELYEWVIENEPGTEIAGDFRLVKTLLEARAHFSSDDIVMLKREILGNNPPASLPEADLEKLAQRLGVAPKDVDVALEKYARAVGKIVERIPAVVGLSSGKKRKAVDLFIDPSSRPADVVIGLIRKQEDTSKERINELRGDAWKKMVEWSGLVISIDGVGPVADFFGGEKGFARLYGKTAAKSLRGDFRLLRQLLETGLPGLTLTSEQIFDKTAIRNVIKDTILAASSPIETFEEAVSTPRKPVVGYNMKGELLSKDVDAFLEGIAADFKANPVDPNLIDVVAFFAEGDLKQARGKIDQLVKDTIIPKGFIKLGAQNMRVQDIGAYTAHAPSLKQLKDWGVESVLLGHSEIATTDRGEPSYVEPDELIARKAEIAVNAGLRVFLAYGETKSENDAGRTEEVLIRQLTSRLSRVTGEQMLQNQMVLAYEPVWAIGEGAKPASTEVAEQYSRLSRKILFDIKGTDMAAGTAIQYGGSMSAKNVDELSDQPNIDGGLIGGASKKWDTAVPIYRTFAQKQSASSPLGKMERDELQQLLRQLVAAKTIEEVKEIENRIMKVIKAIQPRKGVVRRSDPRQLKLVLQQVDQLVAAKTIEEVKEIENRIMKTIQLLTTDGELKPPVSSPLNEGPEEKGGIDLNPGNMDLRTNDGADRIRLPMPDIPLENIKIDGLVPFIIHVAPITNLPLLLGLADEPEADDAAGFQPQHSPADAPRRFKAREVEEVGLLN